MDALSQLIAAEIARQTELRQARVPYGVWIAGEGWLKNEQGWVFADLHREVAQSAAALWGPAARVMAIDMPEADGKSGLQLLEVKFLAQEKARDARRWQTRLKQVLRNLLAWHFSTR